jgi:hypothetical protein
MEGKLNSRVNMWQRLGFDKQIYAKQNQYINIDHFVASHASTYKVNIFPFHPQEISPYLHGKRRTQL